MPIITDHPAFLQIEENTIIWRYLDLDKFESLLRDKALFFCRADKFIDPFEGSIPKKEADYRLFEQMRVAQFHKIPFDRKKAEKNIADLSSTHKDLKSSHLINCWHINNTESDAMWRIYLKDNEGVAIQTTPKKLFESLGNCTEKIYPGKVRYLDYDKDVFHDSEEYPYQSYNVSVPFVHKRLAFAHEKEFRLVFEIHEAYRNKEYWENQPFHKGKLVPINVSSLVEKIILPPTIDQPTKKKIATLASSYGYSFTLEDSKLLDKPIY